LAVDGIAPVFGVKLDNGSFFASRDHDFTGFLRKITEEGAHSEGDISFHLNEKSEEETGKC
jgi:hypothetical protein